MIEKRVQRRLAAILAADVVGFSRLMERDEAGTLDALKSRRQAVLTPVVAQHNGRVVKLMGDGVLVEFASAVDAVQCAVELQRGFTVANRDVVEAQRIVLRIGINLGDIIVEGSDIYGEGVNVAARLEGLAEPGGIYVSATVHDHVTGKLALEFDDLGERNLKNIAKPVHVYRTGTDGTGESKAKPAQVPALPDKPSIAVLPFTNMSGDPEQEYFTDGLTEDIITDLSNVPGFFVIARNSTFAYKSKSTDVRQIAHDLGVKYILEGSARRSAQKLRINAQLINATEGGNHVWAERFDREIADIFDVQDEITRLVVEAVSGKIGAKNISARSRPSNLEAYDLCVRSRGKCDVSKSVNREARSALERAVALDPNYCEAHSNLALSLLLGWMIWGEPQKPDRGNALMHALRAVEIDPNNSEARRVLGYVQLYERNWDEAKLQFESAVQLNPNGADAVVQMAELHVYLGKPQDALTACAQAFRLNPHPPGWYFWNMGLAQIAAGHYEEAVAALSQETIYGTGSRVDLIAALALAGRVPEAQEEARLFLAGNPNWTISEQVANSPNKEMSAAQPFIDGWRLAGLPD